MCSNFNFGCLSTRSEKTNASLISLNNIFTQFRLYGESTLGVICTTNDTQCYNHHRSPHKADETYHTVLPEDVGSTVRFSMLEQFGNLDARGHPKHLNERKAEPQEEMLAYLSCRDQTPPPPPRAPANNSPFACKGLPPLRPQQHRIESSGNTATRCETSRVQV